MEEQVTNGKVELKIKRKSGTEDLPLPKYMSRGSSGMDLCAALEAEKVLSCGEISLVPTGLYIEVPTGYEAQVRPRSGLALKNGIMVVNSPGTIDSDYRGEIGVIIGNFGPDPVTLTRGMRIAQMVIQKVECADIVVVSELEDTTRSSGGFGHTGV